MKNEDSSVPTWYKIFGGALGLVGLGVVLLGGPFWGTALILSGLYFICRGYRTEASFPDESHRQDRLNEAYLDKVSKMSNRHVITLVTEKPDKESYLFQCVEGGDHEK
jgi:hypothetical protein